MFSGLLPSQHRGLWLSVREQLPWSRVDQDIGGLGVAWGRERRSSQGQTQCRVFSLVFSSLSQCPQEGLFLGKASCPGSVYVSSPHYTVLWKSNPHSLPAMSLLPRGTLSGQSSISTAEGFKRTMDSFTPQRSMRHLLRQTWFRGWSYIGKPKSLRSDC